MANRIPWKPPHTCPNCNMTVNWFERTGRKACIICKRWAHARCLVGHESCHDCVDKLDTRKFREVIRSEAHDIAMGHQIQRIRGDHKTTQMVAIQLCVAFRGTLDVREISKLLNYPYNVVQHTMTKFVECGVITDDGKLRIDASDEVPETLNVSFVLNALQAQGLVERTESDTYKIINETDNLPQ